ncbi:MAG TPA: class I SAM-dependent methyltransferase [Terriglobales bacterium]
MLRASPTERFSSRVEHYVRFRPTYPKEAINVLRDECGLQPEHLIADIASGTGLFTRLLLENGNRVLGVEPNADMRAAGEEYLAKFPNFSSVVGTAEATTLPDRSLDFVTAAQAAHWFDRDKALVEFQRILKPGGYLVLLWNDRLVETAGFNRDYEQLVLRYGTDYGEVKRRDAAASHFFGEIPCTKRVLANHQELDFEALQGRLVSSSYIPQPGEASYDPMITDLRRLFDRYQQNGRVRMEYDTKMYFTRF